MQCSRCGSQLALDDNFCRHCGAATNVIDVPVVRREARPLTVWQAMRPAVVRGVMLLAAGAVLRYVAGRAGRAIVSSVLSDGGGATRRLGPFGGQASRHGEQIEILWYRRVRR